MAALDGAPPTPAAIKALETDDIADAFEAHAVELRRFLLSRVQCRETAADITQETYLRLLAQPFAQPVGNLRAFIFRVARNLAIDHVRGRGRRAVLNQGLDNLYAVTGESPPLADAAIAREQLHRLQQALLQLPALTRRCFELCRLDGLAQKEAAVQLGVSLSTVEKHIALALEFLRESMDR
jgi:RNA polymerase sigma-70 factor (ECF subfamily)